MAESKKIVPSAALIGEAISPSRASYWNPTDVAIHKRPISWSSIGLGIAAYLFSQFFQLRGWVNIMGSRIALYGAFLFILVPVFLFAFSFHKWRKRFAVLFATTLLVTAISLDRYTISKTHEAVPAPHAFSYPAPFPQAAIPPNIASDNAAKTAALLPFTIADVNKIVHRIGNPYQAKHPNVSRLELQRVINNELKKEGYSFEVNLPPMPPYHPSKGGNLSFEGITLVNTNPDNDMTAISTGNGSKVTMKGGGIDGFKRAIKTGDDSPVDLTDTSITAPKTSTPAASKPQENESKDNQ